VEHDGIEALYCDRYALECAYALIIIIIILVPQEVKIPGVKNKE